MSEAYKYSLDIILEHILVCEKRFKEIKVPTDFIETEHGKLLLDAIVTRLQAIGETIKKLLKLNSNLPVSHPNVEWNKIVKFRDFISHHYEMLDYEVIFDICDNDLNLLHEAISTEIEAN